MRLVKKIRFAKGEPWSRVKGTFNEKEGEGRNPLSRGFFPWKLAPRQGDLRLLGQTKEKRESV